MAPYIVEVLRTERIYFRIDATDPGDARRRYLADGDQMGSESVESKPEIFFRVMQVKPVCEPERA